MANITASMVKELRDMTGAGMMDCKKALEETGADVAKAVEYLRKKGIAKAEKKASREVNDGLVEAYIHAGGKLGVLVEVNCETDFVAKTDQFKDFVRNLAMHIAATNPSSITREEIPAELVEREMKIYRESAQESGKPDHIVDKIAQGKLEKFYAETVLMEQAYIREPDKSIKDFLTETIGKLGENITIRRFVRFRIGDE
ncbi:MAG: translation elongation factor Ts [Calditrichaeota bacterium]|nr:translation elongation factor Ts [Calditrichota bacterium]MCB9088882.1 translation elongation factor Ts [Calditrichia bacterium]MCB0289040.1 translation elongation factor Ts [Calditrichota bacterium]MCB0295687.1 translation elongation factor Ts [Calditrichota bacterium]MCB0303666.1 translation elongation factor Ts [Calditrichota bacterium]